MSDEVQAVIRSANAVAVRLEKEIKRLQREHSMMQESVAVAAREIEQLRARSRRMEEALRGARSQIHNLPRSASADAAVKIIDAALEDSPNATG